MENPSGAIAVPLSTFGGLMTELSPSDLPEGGSPDNQDCAFNPGGVSTRPALSRVYATPPSSAAIVFQQTFSRQDGTAFNVLMDAAGAIWSENFTSAPGVLTQIGSAPAGSFCKGVVANGRLYMAFNDGLRGTDLPRQWDGTNLDRVTQDGPGQGPALSNLAAAAATLSNSGAGSPVTISTAGVSDMVRYRSGDEYIIYYTTVTIVTSAAHGLTVGQTVSISGVTWSGNPLTPLPSTTTVYSITNSTTFKIAFYDIDPDSGTGGTVTKQAPILSRVNNVVTATTGAVHNFLPGWQVTISGVAQNNLGGGISTVSRYNNITTVTTSTPHNLVAESNIAIVGVTDTTYNTNLTQVATVVSPTQFTYNNAGTNGSSSGGNVQDTWNGQYFIIACPTTTTFTYNNVGPNDLATGSGTATPNGQFAPGSHKCVCVFQTRTGYLTIPSPPVSIEANGGQYLAVSNIPTGPSNVVARILAFTGADGGNYFYIPTPVLDNSGNQIATSTVINDNTTTSALLDFPDTALLSASAIDIDGNNLFRQRILGRVSAVDYYADRSMWIGDDNKVINYINMGFDGGGLGSAVPPAWSGTGSTGGTGLVVTASSTALGFSYQMTSAGGTNDCMISQSAYRDPYATTILQVNTQYQFRLKAQTSAQVTGNLIVELYSPTSGSLATVTFAVNTISTTGGWLSGKFSAVTPNSIPTDSVLRVYLQNVTSGTIVTIDEMAQIYSAKPYNDNQFEMSYVLNPEAVDGLTGNLGATVDPSPIQSTGRLRDNFYWTTKGTQITLGTLQTTKDIASSEPSTWSVNEVAEQCGGCSLNPMISGESFIAWPCLDGIRMFDGSNPIKISQGWQAKWNALNAAALKTISAVNDSANRRMYFAVPVGAATIPNAVYPIDYRFAETANDIEERSEVRVSPYTGKMLVIELSRKFSPWSIQAASIGYLNTSSGIVPTFGDSLGRVYSLSTTKTQDDDYGAIPDYYTTSPFVTIEQAQQLQVGEFRHLYVFVTLFITWTGNLTITPLVNNLTQAWPARGPYAAPTSQLYSLEIPLNVSGEQCFFKISATGTFSLSRMVVSMKPHPMSPVRI